MNNSFWFSKVQLLISNCMYRITFGNVSILLLHFTVRAKPKKKRAQWKGTYYFFLLLDVLSEPTETKNSLTIAKSSWPGRQCCSFSSVHRCKTTCMKSNDTSQLFSKCRESDNIQMFDCLRIIKVRLDYIEINLIISDFRWKTKTKWRP